ncbi:hypothetical protein SSX86_003242 [Deinandra increscens subsp. villosa]|uniref:HMG box domain-containing protein n=1 Tax=Deinandra increscens subsp. villosa TaxID=3103831 RepID=A0AAP0H4T8_9ASTR
MLNHHHYLQNNDLGFGVHSCNNPPAAAFSSLAVGKPPSAAVSAYFPGKSTAEEDADSFYDKLNKLNESSGLSLLFNFRDATLDLHQLYKTVTQRGGYHEADGKWEEVASSASRRSGFMWTPNQLEKIYATILYQFEQTYYYRSPVKRPNKTPMRPDIPPGLIEPLVNVLIRDNTRAGHVPHLNRSMGKRKHDGGFYVNHQHYFSDRETPSKKIEHIHHGFQNSSPDHEVRKAPCVPLGSRNCYQMFIKMETDRLKSINGETSSPQLRCLIEAWRQLSDDDKQPYIEASKKDKERYVREMAAYEDHIRKKRNLFQKTTKNASKVSSPNLINLSAHSSEASSGAHVTSCEAARRKKFVDFGRTDCGQFDGYCNVGLQPDDGLESALVWDEPVVQLAVGLMKNARPPCDPMFEINRYI